MKLARLKDMKNGWFIGNFEPTAFRSPHVEVSYRIHPAGESWPKHYHKIATEINLLVSGRMCLGGVLLQSGDIFILEPGEIADPVFEEDCSVICVKTPSTVADKYVI